MHHCRGVNPTTHNEGPGYDSKQSDSEAPVLLKLLVMGSTFSLISLTGPLWF